MTESKQNDLLNAVHSALEGHIERIKEEVLEEALKAFEKKLRKAIALTVMDVAQFYSYERACNSLVITVNTGGHGKELEEIKAAQETKGV